MKFPMNFAICLIVAICALSLVASAPMPTGEDIQPEGDQGGEKNEVITNACELDELSSLLDCDDSDQECCAKNEQRISKRKAICDNNPQCVYCNETQPIIVIPNYDDDDDEENLVVAPEIVATLSPPLELGNDSIPIDETIVIDGSVAQIIDESQAATTDSTKPLKLIERNIVVENDDERHYYRGYIDPSSNVTTIIRLTNLINNTNIVNVPTTLNNTNINNIHVYNNESSSREGGKYGLGFTEDGPCCFAMKPGLCKKTTAGLKCRHKKTRVCGSQCTRKMIHTQRSFCNQIPYYPYLICPPMAPPLSYYPTSPRFPPQIGEEFDDEEDLPLFPTDEELDSEDSDWIVYQEKCKIVSEDGLHITNCTQKNVDFEHPYARNSVDNVGKRNPRHARRAQQQQQQFYPYGQAMMQPVYFQPIPFYMAPVPPPYYLNPQMNAFYPQQMPMPPIDTESYYDEPMIEIREVNPYKNSRKHARKHPIVFDHDDEL